MLIGIGARGANLDTLACDAVKEVSLLTDLAGLLVRAEFTRRRTG